MTLRETIQLLSEYHKPNHDMRDGRENDRLDALQAKLERQFGWWAVPEVFTDDPEHYIKKGVLEQEVEDACDSPLDYFTSVCEISIEPEDMKSFAPCERKLKSLTPAQRQACADGLRHYLQRSLVLEKRMGVRY